MKCIGSCNTQTDEGDVAMTYSKRAMAPNNAMGGDTVRSALRAPHGARHRGR